MSLKITDDCNNCDKCVPECPNEAISEGDDIFVIDPDKCTECVGFHDEPQCQAVCPVECCLPDEGHKESEAELLAKAKKLHPDEEIPEDFPSHFKND